MNIVLIQEQLAHIELTLETEDEFEVYGGTTRAPFEFIPTGVASWRVVVRESEVAGAAIRAFDIYARQRSSGREWVVLSGKIIVKPRTADVEGDKLSPVEYHVTVPVVDSVVETQGMAIVTGIPGPQGPKGDKGDPGEGGMTEAERALLNGAAQRDAANTFTASNTFTGSVNMSGAQVTPPSGWNVEGVTAEQVKAVVPIAWSSPWNKANTNPNQSSIAIGSNASALKYYAYSFGALTNAGQGSISLGYNVINANYCVSIGYRPRAESQNLGIAIGAEFTETTDSGNVTHTCTTEGTGSITIGAGANTLNNGSTESSNSVTIGCKASNKGADSVVIGAQAKGTASSSVCFGATAETLGSSESVAVGSGAKSNSWAGVAVGASSWADNQAVAVGRTTKTALAATALGSSAWATARMSSAIGYGAQVSDYGATVIRSTAEDGTYTQLYFSGANTPLANTYHGGAPMLGYVTKDSAGNIVAAGTRSLIDLLTDNSTFQPASLDENGEWVMPRVFHPSDLDMPTEEPSEVEEYTPLPVYPIVEPSEDKLRTPTGEN